MFAVIREASGKVLGGSGASGGILGGGFAPPRPPHMVVCTPTTPFLDFGVYFFVILETMFRHFRHFCRQTIKIIEFRQAR